MIGLRKLKVGWSSNRLRCFSSNSTENIDYPSDTKPLYDEHVQLNTLQKTILAAGSGLSSLFNPQRADMIAIFGETTGLSALKHMRDGMLQDPEGMRILNKKPRINSSTVNLEALSNLKEGTLGHCYIQFLNSNKVTPDSRLPVQFIDDAELAYVMQRYREAHDLVHTVLGMPTNMLGEVAVKWVEAFQTKLPMCITGAIFGASRLRPKQRQKYKSIVLPWSLRVGRNAHSLMNIYYEERWEQNLKDLREELSIETPPVL